MGTQPCACSHAVHGVVECEEVGRNGPGVSAPSVILQLAGCDGLAQVHAGGTGNLQQLGISVLEFTYVHLLMHCTEAPLVIVEVLLVII